MQKGKQRQRKSAKQAGGRVPGPKRRLRAPDERAATPRRPVRSRAMQLAAEVERLERELGAARAQMAALAARAEIDPLTDIVNRRGFERELKRACAYVKRYAASAALIYLDLDGFKRVNDEHGHATGDAVLRDFAKVVTDRLRASDMIGRYGGEEFALVLRGTGAVQARAVLDSIRRSLAEREPVNGTVRYTFSAGVAELGVDAAEPMALIARADERLYEAKRAGRDRTV
jgi:diguanylate cyclase (GGDEF)-like protein